MSQCEHCKQEKLLHEKIRFSGVEKNFCSEGTRAGSSIVAEGRSPPGRRLLGAGRCMRWAGARGHVGLRIGEVSDGDPLGCPGPVQEGLCQVCVCVCVVLGLTVAACYGLLLPLGRPPGRFSSMLFLRRVCASLQTGFHQELGPLLRHLHLLLPDLPASCHRAAGGQHLGLLQRRLQKQIPALVLQGQCSPSARSFFGVGACQSTAPGRRLPVRQM